MSATIAETVFQSRWGFHPCNREDFAELKAFHKLLLRDLRATRRFERWNGKLPHNRVRRYRDGRREPLAEPKHLGTSGDTYEWVLAEYRAARKPQSTPELVSKMLLPSGWREQLAALREFYAE